MSFKLPYLNYSYNALEPYFDKDTMEIHHTKHHQAYINNTNEILKDLPEFVELSIYELLKNIEQVPEDKKTALRNNAGGHYNHSMFWRCLKPHGTKISQELKQAIERDFKSIELFQKTFEKVASTCFGSGWIWLVTNNSKLSVISTANQDNPLMGVSISGASGFPILGLDVWEHAYYLKYKNQRLDYIKSFWNIVNWDEVVNNLNLA